MRRIDVGLALVAICLLAAPFVSGQGGNPPASTKERGATSGKGMTAVEQSGKAKGGNVEQQIATLSDQVLQADLKADTSFMEKHFADDYTAIYSSGRLYTKAEDIERIKSGEVKYEALDMRDRKIRVYGDTALVILLVSAKGTSGGKSFSGDFCSTWIFVRQKGNWKKVAFQATRVAPASQ